MKDTAKETVRILFDVLEAHGVRDVVCSPGSRNAPLLIAADARQELTKHVVVDERSAAFVALGLAIVGQCPVALLCTSGTAVLNYAPAVAEAYYQGIPLIIISADRPLEWIDQDDSQTIRQPESLANFVKGSYSLSDRVQGDRPGWYETRAANDAMLKALAPKQGPVHINVRLSPPLGQTVEMDGVSDIRIIRRLLPAGLPDKEIMRSLGEDLKDKRVMVVAGFMNPDSGMTRAMQRMRLHPNVVMMAETISNIHLPEEDYAVDTVLCTLTGENDRIAMAPDVVISCGGALVSRMLKEYLRECARRNPAMEHWCVGYTHTTTDCFQALTLRIDADPAKFIGALTASIAHAARKSTGQPETPASPKSRYSYDSVISRWGEEWRKRKRDSIQRMKAIAADAPWSDMAAYRIIFDHTPPKCNLFLSNGTTVRYAQILSTQLPHAEFCNRGVSGIDGSTSTAVGGALKFRGETILITGDTSFAYDLSALQTMHSLGSDLKIVVINNGGGGIFRFIGTTSGLECRERYFCANPQMPVSGISASYGFRYLIADSHSTLQTAFNELLHTDGPVILEVVTPPGESAAILRSALSRPQ